MVIDFGFGLSQLSGSEDLLITLLGKIKAEYQDCEQTLTNLFEQQQWDDAKVIAHTLKGVSGNLGCVALHSATKNLEQELKLKHAIPKTFDEFVATLNATLTLISKVEEAGTVDLVETPADASNTAQAKQALIELLQDNAFISPDVLDQYLHALNLSTPDRQALEQAVNILDYNRALEILTG